jgi:hypothetical protein
VRLCTFSGAPRGTQPHAVDTPLNSSASQSPVQTMTPTRLFLVAIVASLATSLPAQAQWKWRDRSGIVQYSDRPPPPDVAQKDIIERPASVERRAATAAAAASAASAPAAATASASAPSGVDPELEARRRKAEQEDAAKRRAEDAKTAAQRADNCQRARGQLRALEDGLRLVRTNEKGEREVLDDKGRAEETARTRAVIAADCR